MRLLGHKKKNCSFLKIWILCLTAVLFSLGGCTSVYSLFPSSEKSSAEIQLSTALCTSFSRGWFDKCNSLQNIAEMATDQNSGKSADYLLGYLRGSTSSRTGYFLQSIYTNQAQLKNQVISQEVKQSLNIYASAESEYLEQLKDRLTADGRIPREEAFQTNTKKLANLIPYFNIAADDLEKEEKANTFRENLKKAAQLMRDAFSQGNSTETFAPSDNLILLPVD